jgi:hypothetical protein
MAKYNPAKRGLDEQELEGGATGGGGAGGARASTSGTKWSDKPSFTSNASLIDDIKKINKDTSNLRGNAKKVAEDAQDRAGKRTAIRAAGAGATAAGINAAVSDDSEDTTDNTQPRAGMGEIMSGIGMAKGGSASSRADGIAQRGKTKGRVC